MIGAKTIVEFAKVSDVREIGILSQKYIEHDLCWRYTPEKIKNLIKNNKKNVVLAKKADKLVGFGIMTYDKEQANLDLLAVKLIYRRRGIGKLIVEWLEKVASLAGIFNIYVQVRKINKGAIKFYKKIGFQVIDEKSGYYEGQETAIIMCKSLRQMLYKTNDC